MRALGYVRASTAQQTITLEAQSAAIAGWCAGQGIELVDTITDADVSGSVPFADRPGGAMVLASATATRIDVIVTTVVDRLFRDVLDGLRCISETFPKIGLSAVCVYESLDLSTAEGRFQATIKLAMAQLEREKTAERTQRTSRRLQETGRVYGKTPFGCVAVPDAFDRDGKPINQRLYRDPAQWAVREQIIAAMAKGESLRCTQMHLRAARILAPNGGRQWSTSVLKNLRETHDRLALLPRVAEHVARAGKAAPEAVVSLRRAGHA